MPVPSVRSHLKKVLSSKAFNQSGRMSRFLRFIVEQSLNNCHDQLKEYVIGVEVFDRPASYDPRVDPIVRVEARRLRAKLQQYYEAEGRNDEVVFDVPTGAYAPLFRRRDEAASAAPTAPASGASGIAVLPFLNLSADPENEYFSDGLTEELIHGLTKVEGLRVVAWNSAAQLRGKEDDVRAIGTRLNVAHVLTGSVRRSKERLRIMARLVDTGSGVYLWSETYDRRMQDLFEIQDEISTAIVGALRLKLTDSRGTSAGGRGPADLEAYNLYLKGRYHWNRRSLDELTQGLRHFRHALALHPGFALAHAGLADCYTVMAQHGLVRPEEVMPRAEEAAVKALEIEPALAEAHTSLALIRSHYHWDWAGGERHYREAIGLNPGYATAHHWFGCDYLSCIGELDDALEEMKLAVHLDPLSPMVNESLGFVLMLRREFSEAVRQYHRTLELDPGFHRTHAALGRAYAQMGRYEESLTELERARAALGDVPSVLGVMAQAYAWAGDRVRARGMLDEIVLLSRSRFVSSNCFALVHAALGEIDRAIEHLESGCGRRELPLCIIKVHPGFDALRTHPRFADLIRRIGLDRSRQ